MNINIEYLAQVLNSTLRMMTPVLYASLAAAICNKVKVVNISMEGTMMAGAFFGIVVNYFTHNVFLAVLAAAVSGALVSAIVAACVIKLKADAVVVGMALNMMMSGVTIYLMYLIFNTRGVFTDPSLQGIAKLNLPIIQDIPILGTVLRNLTVVDYLAFLMTGLLYVFLYKTVLGYRIRAIGINEEAARSLGTPVDRYKFWVITLSGILSGLGGSLLSMGAVTLFIQNITSGKGYIALAANNLGQSHPLGVLASSLFFGFTQSLASVLQNTALKSQITQTIPYVATILALVLFTVRNRRKKAKRIALLREKETI